MRKRVTRFLGTYFLIVLVFITQKPLFMLFHAGLYKGATIGDWFGVIFHGLPHDLCVAGYLSVIPGLILLVSAWSDSKWLRNAQKVYFLVISFVQSLIFILDATLYGYWDFRLDATPLFYFMSSPKDALASVSFFSVIGGLLLVVVYAFILYGVYRNVMFRKKRPFKIPYQRVNVSLVILLMTGLLFIPIRGGFSESTMNIGRVYFSQNQRLNHAAINPAFSLLYSLSHQSNFGNQYRFMSAEKADEVFASLRDSTVCRKDGPCTLLTNRPNIVFVILEGFSTHLMQTFGGSAPVAKHLDRLAQRGVLFTNFYGNSFRTDRGLVSILSGYPGQPNTSIMKYSKKTENLPSIPLSLRNAGYDLTYYYGGDADFTNMRSYLVSCGFERIISQTDFPVYQRMGKWGAHDHILFERFMKDLTDDPPQEPFLKVIQTSSSHEPFDVPYTLLEDKVLNAFAYTDYCLGELVDAYMHTPYWDNTLFVLVPDHQGAYPHPVEDPVDKHTIPMIWVGGAVKEALRVDSYGSQVDIAATLLSELGIPHDEFTFSKDMLNPLSPHFAFFTEPSLFGMFSLENRLIYNLDANTIQMNTGEQPGYNLEPGQAYLQKLYDDLAMR